MTGTITTAKIRLVPGGDISLQPGIYIGRGVPGFPPSPLGNPFSAKQHGRPAAISFYRAWLAAQVAAKDHHVLKALNEIRTKVQAGEDVVLLCWCAPLPCHGEIVAEAVLSWNF